MYLIYNKYVYSATQKIMKEIVQPALDDGMKLYQNIRCGEYYNARTFFHAFIADSSETVYPIYEAGLLHRYGMRKPLTRLRMRWYENE